jgi:predicted MFS family arabinose efflux permease
MALLPSLVDKTQLGMAIGMNSVTYNVARVIGPGIAGLLVVAVGYAAAFGLNSLSFLALIGALLLMRPRDTGAAAADGESEGSIREALRYAWQDRSVRLLLVGTITVSMAMDPVLTLSPKFVTEYLGQPLSWASFLISAFGLGAILATVVMTKGFRSHGAARYALLVPWSLVFAAGMLVYAFAPTFGVAVAAVMVTGAGFLVTSTTWTAGLQEMVPNALRGRVMGIWTLCFLGSRPFASIIDGAVADLASPRLAVVLMIIPLLVVALIGAPRLVRATKRS